MLNETGNFITENYLDIKKIGLMNTAGTRQVKIYNSILEPRGFEIIEVDESIQSELHNTIYNTEWGIKAVNPVTPQARENGQKYAHTLQSEEQRQ